MNSILKFHFFSILSSDSEYKQEGIINNLQNKNMNKISNSVSRLCEISTILDLWVVKKQIFLLAKKKSEENNVEYFIYKAINNEIVDFYSIYNRNIFCGRVCQFLYDNKSAMSCDLFFKQPKTKLKTYGNHASKKELPKNNSSSNLLIKTVNSNEYINSASNSLILESYFLILCGSDYYERINNEEKKKELNVLTYIVIVDMSSILDKSDRAEEVSNSQINSKSNVENSGFNMKTSKPSKKIINSIIKKINLVTIPNSIFLNTTPKTESNFESLTGIVCMDNSSDLSLISLGLESGKVVLIFPGELSFEIPSFYNKEKKDGKDKEKSTHPSTFSLGASSNNKINPYPNKKNMNINLLNSQKDYIAVELPTILRNIPTTKDTVKDPKSKKNENSFSINCLSFSTVTTVKGDFAVLYCTTLYSLNYYVIDKIHGKINFYQLNSLIGTFNNGIISSNRKGQVFFNTKENHIIEYQNLSKKASFFFEGRITTPLFLPPNYFVFIFYETSTPILVVYDLKNKFFSYFNNMFKAINFLTLDVYDKSIFFLAENQQETKQVFSLKEKENYHKFNVFYKNHLFEIALDYARNIKYSFSKIAEINKKYGDYLYENNDFLRAVEQYTKTLMYIHPSQIIEKFLDNSKVEYLIMYLERLHKSKEFCTINQSSMGNYSKLLINIYSKLKKTAKLNQLVDSIDFSLLSKEEVNNIINICIEQNQLKTALEIASRARFANKIIDIFLENNSK